MGKPLLTLVPRSDRPVSAPVRRTPDPLVSWKRESAQLSFEFGQRTADVRVAIVAMNHVHGRTLCDAIEAIRPKTILDLRHAVRYDLNGIGQRGIFARIHMVGAHYSIASIPWHDLKPQDIMADDFSLSQRLTHEVAERGEGPVMLFVSKSEYATSLWTYLNRLLSAKAKYSWSVEEVADPVESRAYF